MPDIITYKLGLDLDNREALKTIEELAKKHKELKRILGDIYINLNQKDKGFSIFDGLIS